MSYDAPYKGIKVVDLSQAIAGPYAAGILARHGANVIKVEPGRGDWARNIGKSYPGGHTLITALINLGKRSIGIELKTDGGRDVLRRLLADADIFIESFRPGVTKRLGFGYEDVRAINPRIIYLSVSGFGQSGPFSERPGTDGVLQAFSGFVADNKGADGTPHRSNVLLMDMSAALYNVQALQAALWARQGEKEGRYLDNSLLETAAALQNLNIAARALDTGGPAQPLAYPYAIFPTKDGAVSFGVVFEREYKPLMEMLKLPELANDPELQSTHDRFKNRARIDAPIREAIAAKTTEELCNELVKLRMLHERINNYSDFMHHEQTREMNAFLWNDYPDIGRIPLANIPGARRLGDDPAMLRSPLLGEHTTEILRQYGYSADEISALEAAGAITSKRAAA